MAKIKNNNIKNNTKKKDTVKTVKFNKVQKSYGQERSFLTGAVRDNNTGKGRFDLLPVLSLFRLAKHFENGAARYKARNWELGMHLSVYWDSACRHLLKILIGMTDEDHEAAAMWNIGCFIETKERIKLGILPVELDDMPDTYIKNKEMVDKLSEWFK